MIRKTLTMPAPPFPPNAACFDDCGATAVYLLPRVLGCGPPEGLLDDPCKSYNVLSRSCGPAYYQPVLETDTLYYQFTYPDNINTWEGTGEQEEIIGWADQDEVDYLLKARVTDLCTGETRYISLYTEASTAWVGLIAEDSDAPQAYWGSPTQGIGIDVAGLPDEFYISFEHPTLGTYYTEWYKKVSCDEPTVLFEAISARIERCSNTSSGVLIPGCVDASCAGRVMGFDPATSPYAVQAGTFQYIPYQYRVYASFELTSYTYETNINGIGAKTSTQATELYQLRSAPMHQTGVETLNDIFTMDILAVDGDDESVWQTPQQIDRNNEGGNAWIIDTEIRRIVCQRVRGCVY